jgi:hypothetical protein
VSFLARWIEDGRISDKDVRAAKQLSVPRLTWASRLPLLAAAFAANSDTDWILPFSGSTGRHSREAAAASERRALVC